MKIQTTNSYYKRQLDIECLQSMLAPSEDYTELYPSVSKNKTKAVSGIQKLAQRYVVLFTTELGSDVFMPDFGSTFIKTAERCNVSSIYKLEFLANEANFVTKRLLKDEDPETYGKQNDDERLDDSWIVSVSADYNERKIVVHAAIRSVAGDVLDFVVPTTNGIY